jgi:hypothetical protein
VQANERSQSQDFRQPKNFPLRSDHAGRVGHVPSDLEVYGLSLRALGAIACLQGWSSVAGQSCGGAKSPHRELRAKNRSERKPLKAGDRDLGDLFLLPTTEIPCRRFSCEELPRIGSRLIARARSTAPLPAQTTFSSSVCLLDVTTHFETGLLEGRTGFNLPRHSRFVEVT